MRSLQITQLGLLQWNSTTSQHCMGLPILCQAHTSHKVTEKRRELYKWSRKPWSKKISSWPLWHIVQHHAASPTGASPCQLMMGQQIQTRLPTLVANLQPHWPTKEKVQERDKRAKEAYRANYNWCHHARPLPNLQTGDHVHVKLDNQKDWSTPAAVTQLHNAPHLYIMQMPDGTFRCNRRHLQHIPKTVITSQFVPQLHSWKLRTMILVNKYHQPRLVMSVHPSHLSDQCANVIQTNHLLNPMLLDQVILLWNL